ncbi:transmembrane protein 53 [Erpetoichthys calabaricus]|uniref:Transmembrane protein 53 n=1 Tax=Erpetoichthys calabaricus TaxID=27687 RepID=A0A8C4S7I3_ERPCA|nr:transmembrane protein 53 [Erpetoichthys calabaricus]
MGDSGLDYNIVFPEPYASEKYWFGRKEPVVILLGWAGCKDKHLAKYSSLYNKQGCIAIRYTAPSKAVFLYEPFGSKQLLSIAGKLLDLLLDYEVQENPLLFHVFSNGGFMLYRYIAQLLHSDPQFKNLKVVGTVVDSAPGNQNVVGSVRALNATLGTNTHLVIRYLALAIFTCMVFMLRVLLYSITKHIHENHFDAMLKEPSNWPHLYLYSKADRVIDHRDVERMVKARQQQGFPIKSVDFVTSEHVSHLRMFPELYSKHCIAFLDSCMLSSAGARIKVFSAAHK